MRKIFSIISAVIIGFVGSFMFVLSVVRISVAKFDEPYSINVYYQSSTTPNNESYYADDEVFDQVVKNMNKTLKSSLFTVMWYRKNLSGRAEYVPDKFAAYDTSMKQKNLVIEYIYKETQDIVVYENGQSRVIPCAALLFVIPCDGRYEDIVVYNSISNSQEKEEEYKKNIPFMLGGNPKKLIKYASTIA